MNAFPIIQYRCRYAVCYTPRLAFANGYLLFNEAKRQAKTEAKALPGSEFLLACVSRKLSKI